MKATLAYYVIYSIETDQKISRVKPDYIKAHKWKCVESYVEEDGESKLNCRKYMVILTPSELQTILKHESWTTCETLGTLTLEYGLLDAISFTFTADIGYTWLNAYISPIFENEEEISEVLHRHSAKQQKLILEREVSPKLKKLHTRLLTLEPDCTNEIPVPQTITLRVEQSQLPLIIRKQAQA